MLVPLPHFRFRFCQNAVILLLAIPPTYLEAAAVANRFRFRFQNLASKAASSHTLDHSYFYSGNFSSSIIFRKKSEALQREHSIRLDAMAWLFGLFGLFAL